MKRILHCLSLQVLGFPILVVLFASAEILLGGRCAAWQWWVAFAIAAAFPFVRMGWRDALMCDVGFCAAVVGLFVVCFLNTDPSWVDNDAYHLPGTRMLMDGWNPFWDATPEKICMAMRLDTEEMRVWHVLSVQKAVWVFNAVAFLFHGDVLCVTYSAGWFVFWAFVLFVLSESEWHGIAKTIFICLVWKLFSVGCVVDSIVGVAGVSLLMAMHDSIQRGRVCWPYLLGFSFWMMTAKAPGALACFAMWVAYSGFVLFKTKARRKCVIGKLALVASLLALTFLIVCASPYIASWREYGHPLYPAATTDESKFPRIVITDDIVNGNEDFQAMGAVGKFANAYISPSLTRKFYNWRWQRTDFAPMNRCWFVAAASEGEPTATCPTTLCDRLSLWCSIVILIFSSSSLFLPVAILSALVFVPPSYYGYLRYCPWLRGIEMFAFVLFGIRLVLHFKLATTAIVKRKYCVLCLCGIGVLLLPKEFLSCAIGIDQKLAAVSLNAKEAYVNVYGADLRCKTANIPVELRSRAVKRSGGGAEKDGLNSLRLLSRRCKVLKGMDFKGTPQEALEGLHKNPLGFFTREELPLEINMCHVERSRFKRLLIQYPIYALKMLTSGAYRLYCKEREQCHE